jgi:hypothetical protein
MWIKKSGGLGSNQRPHAPKAYVLTKLDYHLYTFTLMVLMMMLQAIILAFHEQ